MLRAVSLLLLVPSIAVATVCCLASSSAPTPVDPQEFSPQDSARARDLLQASDRRRKPAGRTQRIAFKEQALNFTASDLLRKFVHGDIRLGWGKHLVELADTQRLAYLPLQPFLTVVARLGSTEHPPYLAQLRVGQVAAPLVLTEMRFDHLLARTRRRIELQHAENTAQQWNLAAEHITASHSGPPKLINAVRDSLLTAEQRAALQAYYEKLIALQAAGVGKRGSLANLLQPMFAYAQSRDPALAAVAENRALLLVLGAWASGRGLSALLPDSQVDCRPHRFRLTLHRRNDFAQHFLLSAALAAGSDSKLANAIGLFKEIADIDSGSGFSFTDIAAARAGTRFGELAVRSNAQAQRVQQHMTATFPETDLLPPIRDLPEHLSGTVFKQRYGSVGSPAYRAVMDDIRRRLDQAPLLN